MSTSCSWYVADRRLHRLPYKPLSILLILFSLISCVQDTSRSTDTSSVASYASLDASTSYVGMQTCRQCHAGIYDSYVRTGMGRSFEAASRKKSAADFSSETVLHDQYRDLSYHPRWTDGLLCFDEFRLDGKDTSHLRSEQVSYIVGSGQHTNSHLVSFNGYVYQAPMTYYTQEGRWDFPPGFEGGHNSRFSRKIEAECMTCHNAYPVLETGSENKYVKVPSGIDCERCHGPGSAHVEAKRNGELVDTSRFVDYTIVHPGKLPIDLQLDVCQRCHIQGNAVLQPGKSFFDFRPAMKLSEVMDVYMPVFKGGEKEHIMASHAERMKLSKCFLSSHRDSKDARRASGQRPMTCITCHNPHVSVKETGPETFNNACRNCHGAGNPAESTCKDPVATRKQSGGDCSGCHMPKNNTIDIPHVVTTDHRISVPVSKKEKNAIKEFVTLACINNQRPSSLSRAIAYLNYHEKFVSGNRYLDSAAALLNGSCDTTAVEVVAAQIRLAYLAGKPKEVIRLSKKLAQRPGDQPAGQNAAWTAYRIGDAYLVSGFSKDGLAWLRSAVSLAPQQLDFRFRLATALHQSGLPQEAETHYRFLLAEQPKQPAVLVNYGFLLLSERNEVQRADSMYAAAVRLDPDYLQALINLAGTRFMLGDFTGARRYTARALKLDPANTQVKAMSAALASSRR